MLVVHFDTIESQISPICLSIGWCNGPKNHRISSLQIIDVTVTVTVMVVMELDSLKTKVI